LIVGIVRLHPCSRETFRLRKFRWGFPPRSLFVPRNRAKRNRAIRSLLTGKRSTATEDLGWPARAFARD
jgi:hypothetical protein